MIKRVSDFLRRSEVALAVISLLFFVSKAATAQLYVGNFINNAVEKIDASSGVDLGQFVSQGLNAPTFLAFDSSSNLYVANGGNNTIIKYAPSGAASIFATNGLLNAPFGVALDSAGNLYVANRGSNTIVKFTTNGVGSIFASGLPKPIGLAFDQTGNLYVSVENNNSIEKLTPNGVGTVFATNGLNFPFGLAFDAFGNLYVANYAGKTIEKFTTNGAASFVISNGLNAPAGLAFDTNGNLYLADMGNNVIEKITTNGVVSVFASNGLSGPVGLAFLPVPLVLTNRSPLILTNLLISPSNQFVFETSSIQFTVTEQFNNGSFLIVSNGGTNLFWTSSNPAVASINTNGLAIAFAAGTTTITVASGTNSASASVTVANLPNLIISPANSTIGTGSILQFSLTEEIFTGSSLLVTNAGPTVAWSSSNPGVASIDPNGLVTCLNNGVTAISASFNGITTTTILTVTSSGVYNFTTFAGTATPGFADGGGPDAQLNGPEGVAVDKFGNVYVVDSGNETVRQITPAGVVNTIAGSSGASGYVDGMGSFALFNFSASLFVSGDPYITTPVFNGIGVDGNGVVYVADSGNTTVRVITPAGTNWIVSSIPTSLTWDPNQLGSYPSGITVDSSNNIYVAFATPTFAVENAYNYVRKLTPAGTNWIASTVATDMGNTGFGAQACGFSGIAVDFSGNIYVAAYSGYFYAGSVLKFAPTGSSSTVTNAAGYGVALDGQGELHLANYGIAVDGNGYFYEANYASDTIQKITPAGVTGTLAGSGSPASFNGPCGVAVDSKGYLYVADTGNSTIRTITPAGVVNTLAGLAQNTGDVDQTGSSARFNQPQAIAVAANGNIYVADTGNNAIRMVTPAGMTSTIGPVNHPCSLALDNSGNIYVADETNAVLWKLSYNGTSWSETIIITNGLFVSGEGFTAFGALCGNGTTSEITGVAVDLTGNLYLTLTYSDNCGDPSEAILLFVQATQTPSVTNSARLGQQANGSDRYYGEIYQPSSLCVDRAGNAYVAASYASQIAEILPGSGSELVIGGSARGRQNGPGTVARFNSPSGIAVNSSGTLYVADTSNNIIRKGVFSPFAPANFGTNAVLMNAQLQVTLLPSQANGQWQLPWEAGWHNSGDIVSNLAPGLYLIVLNNEPGYVAYPSSFSVALSNNALVSITTNVYLPTINSGGSLTVNINPVNLSGGWRFLGETNWRAAGSTATNLVQNTYYLQFEPVGGYVTPVNQSITIAAGQPVLTSATYYTASAPPANVSLPTPIAAGNIADLNDFPFGFNGQLQSDPQIGYGSGVAVGTNVVLTAAHLVFDDQTLSFASSVFWYWQEETGSNEPQPLLARSTYVLSGYASQRTNDLSGGLQVDQSSAQSRNFDAAALYFSSPVAGGAYGGYLSSDAIPNAWLSSSANKMLVGYPVDGSLFGYTNIVPGLMYEVGPQPYPLSLDTEIVTNQQEVYTANWFLSYPGSSGGPLNVEYNGYYYPAGIYLGTLFSGTIPYASAVRAIDSNIVSLIVLAQNVGAGTNNTGGGVITIIPDLNITANNPGIVEFQLEPPAAVQAGAAWKLVVDSSYSTVSNYVREITTTDAFQVQFKPINGWNVPSNQTVKVDPGKITTPVAFYIVTNPVLQLSHASGLGLTGTTNTKYLIQEAGSPKGPWNPVSTNIIVSSGFNLVLSKSALTNHTSTFYRAVWLP